MRAIELIDGGAGPSRLGIVFHDAGRCARRASGAVVSCSMMQSSIRTKRSHTGRQLVRKDRGLPVAHAGDEGLRAGKDDGLLATLGTLSSCRNGRCRRRRGSRGARSRGRRAPPYLHWRSRTQSRRGLLAVAARCQRRSKISPPGRSKTSPLNVMRYAVLGGCPGSP